MKMKFPHLLLTLILALAIVTHAQLGASQLMCKAIPTEVEQQNKILDIQYRPNNRTKLFYALWEVAQGLPTELIQLILSYESRVLTLPSPPRTLSAFTYPGTDHTIIAAGMADGTIAICDVQKAGFAPLLLRGSRGPVNALSFQKNPKNESLPILISASTLYGNPVRNIKMQDNKICIKADTASLKTGDEPLHVWEPQTGACLGRFEVEAKRVMHDDEELSRQLRSSKRMLKRSLATPQLLFQLFSRQWNFQTKEHLEDASYSISIPFEESPNGTYVKLSDEFSAQYEQDGTIRVVHHLTKKLYTLRGHAQKIFGACLHQNYLISVSLDGTIRIWNILQERCTGIITDHRAPIKALSVSDDGKIFSGDEDGTILMHSIKECMV